ncbi:MAG TPA: DoxX family membrane protein [Firmicutes bacterium]|nr:DoxX family membrane protein [Bacillota bacterium]
MSNLNIDKSSESAGNPPAVPGFIYHFCRIALGLVFIIAGYDKFVRPWDFGIAIYVYKMLTGPFAYLISPMAVIMPVLEFVAGFFLLINRVVRPSALIILALNIIFVIAILSAMIRGMDIDCGCGFDVGLISEIAGTQADLKALIRDFVLIAMNLVVLFAPQSKSVKN